MLRSKPRLISAATLLGCLGTLAVAAASADTTEGGWQHTVVVYGMGAALSGDATVADVTVPVDLSASDVFDALEMGAMGAYRADNGTWSILVDATFMGLGGTAESKRDIVKGDVDMDQFTLMGTLGRYFTRHLEGLLTLTYIDLSNDLKVTLRNPVTGAQQTRSASADASWVDPMLGLRYSVPFADQWRVSVRGDVGGFGIGSDFSWQGLATVHWQGSDTFGAVLGYRVIGFDYEDGHKGSRHYQRYDLVQQGPLVGVTIAF